METDNKKPQDSRKLADQIKDALAGITNDDELGSDEAMEIFNELSANDAFEQEIEQILACLNEQTMELTKLQTQIIILIQKYLGKLNNKKLNLKVDEQLISKNVTEVSSYLMQQHSQLVKESNRGLIKSKDNLHGISRQSRLEARRLVKNFALYQVYKFMNPKKIAGETKKENFAYNMIKGGMDLATQYEGGAKSDIKSYSPEFLKKLNKAHQNFKSGGKTIY
ncbi:DUF5394 family protein [Rickettsia endosymbiont of Oedothorax gibbosus]|uniref:DUF5394 family protein n=1 Tax=Rickettsia endosymbiont of Oedothorax gibbosus TaxID=931099 RepID=UPI002024F06D|nr:DUF5394 family protein [Rickettsia endosymbiont of Oedothorax gibbosus]